MLILALLMMLPAGLQDGRVDLALQDGTRIVAENGTVSTTDGETWRIVGTPVAVSYEDIEVRADWAEYNTTSKQLYAGDRVHFTRGEEELEGGRLVFNRATKTGTFDDVTGQVEGFFVTAKQAERLADGRWVLRTTTFTSCAGECPSWNFTVNEAIVEPGNRVTGKNTVFRFFGIPMFYLPYAMVPTVNRERSSGFLIPSTSTSTTKGRSVRESFYWAINRSWDATFTGEYFSERGPAGTINVRAVPRANTQIEVSNFFAIDRQKQGGQSTGILAQTNFGDGWRGVADLNFVSSFPFRQIYEEGLNLISSPIEHSSGFLTNNREHSSLNFLYNRSAIFFPDSPSVALRKFPAVDFSLPTASIGSRIPVYFSLDAGVAGVARRDRQVDVPPFMQRIDIRPTVEIPVLRSALVQWNHRLSLRETVYTHSLQPRLLRKTLNRGAFDYSMRLTGPQLEGDFGSWRHIVEPTMEYRYVTGIDQFRDAIVVDEVDLMANTHEIEYGVTNRFLSDHEFLSLRIAQKIYFDPEFGGALAPGRRNTIEPLINLTGFAFSDGTPRRFSPIVSTVRIATSPQTSTDLQVDYDTQTRQFRSAAIMGALTRGELYSGVAYLFNKRSSIQSPSNQLNGVFRYGSDSKPGISAGFSFYADIRRSLWQGSTAQVSYNTGCYGLNFEFTQYDIGARKESRFRFSLTLKNLGSFGTLRSQERLF